MSDRDLRLVFIADSVDEGHIMVACLAAEGIEARFLNDLSLGGFTGHHGELPGRAYLREVWVIDPDNADRARQIVREKVAAFAEARTLRLRQRDPVSATCEECGQSAEFPAAEIGTVQDCPHCGAYLDVPDGESADDSFDDSEAEPPPEHD